jgi:hypothetical protein
MKYIGNFKNWIKEEWVTYLLNNHGIPRPNTVGENPNSEEFKLGPSVGYDLSKTWWYHYSESSCPLKIVPPISVENDYMGWFIKLLPGGMMPMHRDPHVTESHRQHVKRYWMPLQDYVPGHMFVYNNLFMTDYQAGDLWVYDDSNEIHGCANIGYTPRLTFQFSTYDTPS